MPDSAKQILVQAHWMNARAIRYKRPGKRGRIVKLECPHCGREWDVANRGRETGFIAAAADNHTSGCAKLIFDGATVDEISYRKTC